MKGEIDMDYSPYVWMDNEIIPKEEANISVFAHTLHYGDGAFEGISVYKCIDGRSAIFRLMDHVNRLFFSATANAVIIPFTPNEIYHAIIKIVRENALEEGYVRPLVIVGEGDMGPYAPNNPIHVALMTWKWGSSYMGADALKNGVSLGISKKWRRVNSAMPFSAKVVGNYVNAKMVKKEAKENGFQDGIILNQHGHIAEVSAANIFLVKNNILKTPSLALPILSGITRASILTLARCELCLAVEENLIDNADVLFDADEAFVCGTAVEVSPIREVDNRLIGSVCPGPITTKIQELFFKAVKGELPAYQSWLTYV